MVEINNQRKGVPRYWRGRRTDNGRQKTRNRSCDVIVGGGCYWLLRSPRKLVTLNPKLKSTGAGRYQLLSVGGMPTRDSLAWKTSLRKVRTLWHCSRLRSVALYLWLIVVISVRQSTVTAISTTARALVDGFRHKADSLIAKFKEAGGTVREIDVWAESPRLSPLWLSASSSACHGLLIITVITPLPTQSPARQKCQRTEAGERGNCWHHAGRQRDVAALDAKYTKELADAKAENDALLVLPLVVVGCIKAVYPVNAAKPPPPAWIMQPPPTGRHRWTGLFHPQREADHYAKTTGRNPEVY